MLIAGTAWVFSPFDGLGWVQYDVQEIPAWNINDPQSQLCSKDAIGCHHFGWIDGHYDAKMYVREGWWMSDSKCPTLWHEILHAQGLQHEQMPHACLSNYFS